MGNQHRIMFNGDNCCFFYSPWKWQPQGGRYSKEAIHNYVRHLKKMGIDTFLLNPNGQLPAYPSKYLPYLHQNYRRDDREFWRAHLVECEQVPEETLDTVLDRLTKLHNLYLDLIEQGVDWLEEAASACREEGISPWISMRMNDTHGGRSPKNSNANNDILRNHPELLMDKPSFDPEKVYERYALNYLKPECRDFMNRMIEDVLFHYDYEGLELDFNRDPQLVTPVAAPEEVETITEWIRQIKRMVDRRSKETGRKIPLGIKTSFHINLMKDFGLDILTLVKEETLDFISFSNFYQTSWQQDISEERKLIGDKISIYGYVEGAVNWMKTRSDREIKNNEIHQKPGDYTCNGREMMYSGEFLRGNAAGKLVTGADGLILFNAFMGYQEDMRAKPCNDVVPEIGSLESLRGKEKAYTFSTNGLWHLTTIPLEQVEQLPALVGPGSRRSFRLPMCAEPADADLELEVALIVEKKEGVVFRPAVSVNTHWPITQYEETDDLLFPTGDYNKVLRNEACYIFRFPVSMIQEGWNEFWIINMLTDSDNPAVSQQNVMKLAGLDIGIKKHAR